jgi:D-glycero-D-manno-heptose 1,7-bisphosphate phosphatase
MICEIFNLPQSRVPRTLLLDRDQTLIADEGYFHDSKKISYLDSNFDYIQQLDKAGIAVILISNQSGIGRGIFPTQAALEVNKSIANFFQQNKGSLCASIFCPHLPTDKCVCRKPEVTMLQFALRVTQSAIKDSLFIGDKESDFRAAENLGVPFIKSEGLGIRSFVKEWI